ncbi:Carbohydrate sulfotransferase 11 [Varanus komodoensis]|uniref:Carbohydrate sulfotransferase n=1 Tax=Varanus komodoensis TaxID=61221 RepID=A0A8D2LW61_VARKO|nr:carbohydrate sulfotransferase 8-like [Varanus komodoensis]KAF7254519.1 Carbohydrate sulfotransferase 11 [Varanus komodoensis]
MQFLTRVCIFASLGFISLLWWSHLLWRPTRHGQGNLIIKDEGVHFPYKFDTLLHIQQSRKKMLRSFCSKNHKIVTLPPSQEETSQLLSFIAVNNKLHFLYCKIPGTGVKGWEQLLEMLEEKGVTPPMPIPYHQLFGTQKSLRDYNLSSMENMLKSYTKVMFIREPFQRLISAYLHGLAKGVTFQEFIQNILSRGSMNASAEWAPLVNLCHPCLVQYDYIIMFGSLGSEVQHLLLRAGVAGNLQIPVFKNSKSPWAYRWSEEQMLSKLSLMERTQLCHFFQSDFAAFHFPSSLLWYYTCVPRSNSME